MAEKLYGLGIAPTKNIEEVVDGMVCDPNLKSCMFEECNTCKNDLPKDFTTGATEDVVSYFQWRTVKETILGDDSRMIKITKKKVKINESQQNLLAAFLNALGKFKRHLFTIRHQFSTSRDLHQKLLPSE